MLASPAVSEKKNYIRGKIKGGGGGSENESIYNCVKKFIKVYEYHVI